MAAWPGGPHGPPSDHGHPLGARGRVACAAGCWARVSVVLVSYFCFFSSKSTRIYCIDSGSQGMSVNIWHTL